MLCVTVTRPSMANVTWRSTEIFKKFPADLVFLRDSLLVPFGRVETVTCEIVNATVHPLYFANLIPHLADPVTEMEKVRRRDERFWRLAIRQAKDLLCGGTANANFAQAHRVNRHALGMMDPSILRS